MTWLRCRAFFIGSSQTGIAGGPDHSRGKGTQGKTARNDRSSVMNGSERDSRRLRNHSIVPGSRSRRQ